MIQKQRIMVFLLRIKIREWKTKKKVSFLEKDEAKVFVREDE